MRRICISADDPILRQITKLHIMIIRKRVPTIKQMDRVFGFNIIKPTIIRIYKDQQTLDLGLNFQIMGNVPEREFF